MSRTKTVLNVIFLLGLAGICQAHESEINSEIVADSWHCASPTNGLWTLNDQSVDKGIELGFGITGTYQANVKGGNQHACLQR
jgi:hypothetical protein